MATFLKIFYIETPQEVEVAVEVTIDIQEDDGDRSVGQEPSVSYSCDDYRLLPNDDKEPHTAETVAFFKDFDFEEFIDDQYGNWWYDYCDDCHTQCFEDEY